MNEQKIISFYASADSQGLRTVSLAFANRLAQQDYSVLYVELDDSIPAIAQSLLIQTKDKNINSYLKQTVKGQFNDVEKFILTKKDIIENAERKEKNIHSGLEEELAYLVYPMELEEKDVPNLVELFEMNEASGELTLEDYVLDYMERFTDALKLLPYDFIVCKLPQDVDHVFTFEMMKHSHQVIAVTTPSITRHSIHKKRKKFLFEQSKELESKWVDVLNMTSEEVSESEYREILKINYFIPFDTERQDREFSMESDSPVIRKSLERMILDLGINIPLMMDDSNSMFKKLFNGRG